MTLSIRRPAMLAFFVGICAISPISAYAAPAYRLAATIPLGQPDHWDYVVADPSGGRVYVAHGDKLAVIDAKTHRLVGNVEGIAGGTHGTAISAASGQGFTDDGENGRVIAFDLKTLVITKSIPAADDADAAVTDPVTGKIFVIEGDPGTISVVDPKFDTVVATIAGGEKMEYAAADGAGAIFVAGEEKGDLLKIDARTNRVAGRWPIPGCTSPHGLAYDKIGNRLFMGCTNSMMIVIDAGNGRVVTTLPIGKGSDAITFDPVRRRVFSSNGRDGTITIYHRVSPDRYVAIEPLETVVSARTMAVDPTTGSLFVAAADTQPDAAGGRPHVLPGTLRILVYTPINEASSK